MLPKKKHRLSLTACEADPQFRDSRTWILVEDQPCSGRKHAGYLYVPVLSTISLCSYLSWVPQVATLVTLRTADDHLKPCVPRSSPQTGRYIPLPLPAIKGELVILKGIFSGVVLPLFFVGDHAGKWKSTLIIILQAHTAVLHTYDFHNPSTRVPQLFPLATAHHLAAPNLTRQ
jgi:hypothetical protein